MAEKTSKNQSQTQAQNQAQTLPSGQDPSLRRPPRAGGPRRTTEVPARPQGRRKSWFKKAMPYLIAGGSTGAGIGLGLSNLTDLLPI